MSLKQIVEYLIQGKYSLEQAMRLAKVELFDHPSSEFKSWIDSELLGYEDKGEMPDYRITQCEVICVLQNSFGNEQEKVADVRHIDKWLTDAGIGFAMSKMYIGQGIATIEEQARSQKSPYINMDIPSAIQKDLADMYHVEGGYIKRFYQQASSAVIGHLLDNVKNKFISGALKYSIPHCEGKNKPSCQFNHSWDKLSIQDIADIPDDKPILFISYSWDSEEHRNWVLKLAWELQQSGAFYVIVDKMLKKGQHFTRFMDVAIQKANYVLVIGTPNYLKKYSNGSGGAAYEETIITQELMANVDSGKFIPILKDGDYASSFPAILKGISGYNFKDDSQYESNVEEIISDLG